MNSRVFNAMLLKTGIATCVLLLASGAAMAQSVTLTAAPTTTTLPDGQVVPMWGYSCSSPSSSVTCTAANGSAQTGGIWQPPLITVPAGPLTITLVNNLHFSTNPPTNTTFNDLPTSLVIVGQLGGGLGDVTQRTTMPIPTHAPQGTTWPGTLGDSVPSSCLPGGDPGAAATFCPPAQANRVRSFGTEVTVADGSAGRALTWSNLRPGTYLIESGTQPSIQGPMGLYGVLVVTDPLATPTTPQAYGTTFDKDAALLLSEIDPVQNTAVDTAVRTAGFSDTKVWNGQAGKCGDVPPSTTAVAGEANTCYPPAVNYAPLYFLINGVSFDRTNAGASALAVTTTGNAANTGRVLLRFVNAGLRMHVPSVIGSKMALLAEDGNKLPGTARLQSEVLLVAGKTYDVTIQPTQSPPGTYAAATYGVFDRALGLSTGNQRDGGMQAYVQVAGGALPAPGVALSATDKTYYCVAGTTLAITDPSKGVLAGATGANGAALGTTFTGVVNASRLSFQSNGTFTYTPPATGACGGSFTYLVNGQVSATHTATITQCDASTNGGNGCSVAAAPVVGPVQFTSNVATRFASAPPGVLAGVTANTSGLALTAVGPVGVVNADGSFVATPTVGSAATCPTLVPALPTSTVCRSFSYQAKNSQGTLSNTGTATVIFLPASNLAVNVKDAKNGVAINDYRWMIEEDKTFWIDPKCQINTTGTRLDSRGLPCAPLPVESLGYNFHTAHMPVIAQGCFGPISCEFGQRRQGTPVACDVGNGDCRDTADQKVSVPPGAVYLDPNKRYFISVMPGDNVNTTIGGSTGPVQVDPTCDPTTTTCAMRQFDIAKDCGAYNPSDPRWQPGNLGNPDGSNAAMCGHSMGGAQIAAAPTATPRPPVNISLQQIPLPTAKIAVFVFQDDNPLNGENDAGGGVDIVAPNEPGLGGFEIKIFDQGGGLGDNTGQVTYDEFNMPVSNALAGRIDPITGLNACPITARTDGLVGMVPTCPKFESDGVTLSPLAGQAVIANLYPGLYEIVATPAADRIGRGEEWLQTNTLDGGKAHEAFIKPNEPGYFQEFGPGGFHVAIGFANPKIINDRKAAICAGQTCNGTLNVQVTSARMSRTPDQRIYSSGDYAAYGFTQCYVSVGPPDQADFAFAKCDADGRVSFTNMPRGNFKVTVFDQWNDLLLDGLVSPVTIDGSGAVKEFPVTQWRANLYTRTFIDQNGDGVSQDSEPGLALVNTNIRYRDGSFGFFNNTDLNGFAGFNEVFPFINWLVVETSSTRFKQTGTHVVYDAGGPADGSPSCSATSPCGGSTIAASIANTVERVSLPPNQRVPGAVYCADADCTGASIATGAGNTAGTCTTDSTTGVTTCTGLSTGRIDPPMPWGPTQAWQGLLGQSSFIEFGMKPFAPAQGNLPAENGGIKGHVIYASTRPFDDPSLSLQLSWEPGVPHVTINLYQKTVDANGSEHLTLVDHTTTTSWDDWAQGFRSDGVPNMNCPGQDPTSPFFQTLRDSKQWLDPANPKTPLTNRSLFKCYDGWSQLNQVQPAPYDGMYKFPSVTGINPANGKPSGTSCSICVANPTGDGTQMLPAGKYVVEVIVPPGFELVKEEDKNILLGDVYIAPVTQQFGGPGNIFIMPDQAAVNAYYNKQSPGSLNLTTNLGATPRHEGDTGSVETFWPCVGARRIVPDLNSLFPGAGQAAPFAGASRHLCDRKEVTLQDEMTALAKFFIFSSTHIAGHFTGTMTNDFASEFDPFSPQFGEKFSPPNLPISMRDFSGNEVTRVYADQWGIFNGLYFSTNTVNPPNPTGYAPQMSIACMNDPGPIPGPNGTMITDPAYSPAYSNFCYEMPFMPGFTAYMDTPVIPTQAFADGYNLPDSEYPDGTPAIGSVTSSSGVAGPWVSAAGQTLTINCLGSTIDGVPCSKIVQNPNFSGPNASTAPYNQKTIARHYGFGTSGTVTIAGVPATCGTWTNTQLVCTVPSIPNTLDSAGVGSTCQNSNSTTIPAGQTPGQRGDQTAAQLSNYRCGQLVITRTDNSKRSIDAITVTNRRVADDHGRAGSVRPHCAEPDPDRDRRRRAW
jgi:Multicopper oxidase